MCISKKFAEFVEGQWLLAQVYYTAVFKLQSNQVHITDVLSFPAWMRWSCSTGDGRIPHSQSLDMNLTLLWNPGVLNQVQWFWVYVFNQGDFMVCVVAIKPQPTPFWCSSSLSSVLTIYIISELTSSKTGHPYDGTIAVSAEVITHWVDPLRRDSGYTLGSLPGSCFISWDGSVWQLTGEKSWQRRRSLLVQRKHSFVEVWFWCFARDF